MKLTEDLIVSSLQEMADQFGKDELSFLALTTKIELPLRDRWAYVLYKKLEGSNFVVSREWKRTDLAVIERGKPKVLIEIKALYTFDAVSARGNYAKTIAYLQEDEDKALKLANSDTKVYTLLLATHPLTVVPTRFKSTIKYIPGINGALSKCGSAASVAKIARHRIEDKFRGKHIASEGTLQGGSAFGVHTDIMYWLVRKK